MLPFSSFVGAERAKRAIILNLINPQIGGALLRGESGSGKTTLLRSLQIGLVCPNQIGYQNLIGDVDLSSALKGEKLRYQSALLQAADGRALILDQLHLFNRGVLNTIINAQQSGQFSVERSGFSKQFKTNFSLLAALNPSESALSAAVIDDFGIIVDLERIDDLEQRRQIIRLAMTPTPQLTAQRQADAALRNAISRARRKLKQVVLPFARQLEIAQLIDQYALAGNHLDIKLMETARALAAYQNRTSVAATDISEAAELVLYGRRQQNQPVEQDPPNQSEQPESGDDQPASEQSEQQRQQPPEQMPQDDGDQTAPPAVEAEGNVASDDQLTTEKIGDGITFKIGTERERLRDQIIGLGKREKRLAQGRHGHTVYYRATTSYDDIDIFGTIMKAAPQQHNRHSGKPLANRPALIIKKTDLQRKVREQRIGNTLIFLLDASGSLRANQRMAALKGTIFNILGEAYVKRDKVALIAFRDSAVDLVLPITGSTELANRRLKELPNGGNSPIAAALDYTNRYIQSNQIKSRESKYVLIFLSDGRANASAYSNAPIEDAKKVAQSLATLNIKKVFIDYESGRIRLGLMKQLAELADAELVCVDDMTAQNLTETIQLVR